MAIALILLGCAAAQVPTPDTLEELLARAKAQGLVTSVEELAAGIKQSDRDSSRLYAAAASASETGFSEELSLLGEFLNGTATLEDAEKALARMADWAKKLEVAAAMPDYAPVRDWRRPLDITVPEVTAIRDAGRLFSARAVVRAEKGNEEGAFADLAFVANAIRHVGQERFLIGKLLQRSVLRKWSSAMQRLASEFSSDTDALKRLSDAAASVREPNFKEGIGFEIALYRRVLQQVRSGDVSASELATAGGGQPGERNEALDILFRAAADEAELIVVGYLVSIAEAWGDAERISKLSQESYRRLQEHEGDPAVVLATVLVPTLPSYHGSWLDAVATFRAARIGTAAAHLRAKTGKWPSLSEAAKEAGVSPDDPFRSGNLAYMPSAVSLLIYSVGPNGKDDGGVKRTRENRPNYDVAMFWVILRSGDHDATTASGR